MPKIGFIGAGAVGTAFGVRLSQLGYEVIAVYNVSLEAAQRFAKRVPGSHICQTAQELVDIADFVFITTPDDSIPKVDLTSFQRCENVFNEVNHSSFICLNYEAFRLSNVFRAVMHVASCWILDQN